MIRVFMANVKSHRTRMGKSVTHWPLDLNWKLKKKVQITRFMKIIIFAAQI